MKEQLIKAARMHAEGEYERAKTNIMVYMEQSVGIGEHSELLVEINKWTHKLAEADENLTVLKQYFEDDGYAKEEKRMLNG